MGRQIGRIVEVRGTFVKAELYELFPPYLVKKGKTTISPRINSFVKTKVGLDDIICQVVGEYFDEQMRGSFTGYFLELSVKGYIDDDHFVQGLKMLPMVSSIVELLDEIDLCKLNECSIENGFSVGYNLFDPSQKCYFDYNKIIPSHVGIFGNTGSGKSNTLAKLLNKYTDLLVKNKNGKIIIFDLNNEYGGNSVCDYDRKEIYKLTTRVDSKRKIPLNYSKLTEDEWCVLLNATEATQKPLIKSAFKDNRDVNAYVEEIKNMILTGQRDLIRSLQYNMKDYIYGLEGIKWYSKGGKYYIEKSGKNIYSDDDGFYSNLDFITVKKPNEKLQEFIFSLFFAAAKYIGFGVQYSFLSPLLNRAVKLKSDFEKVFIDDHDRDIFGEKQIIVVQLANTNNDMKEIIPSIVTEHIFESQVEKKQDGSVKEIVNIVIDEAHNLLYEKGDDGKHENITLKTFERTIKEGRKFGVFLWVSSQRPSDISSTILSQVHNYFIHKLVNPFDLNRIKKSVAFLDQNSIDSLTVLGPGECIVSGQCTKMPCFIKVDQLNNDQRPNSENVVLFGKDGIFENEL